MTDVAQREWQLIRRLRAHRPPADSSDYKVWCELRNELLSIDLVEALQHSLLLQFPQKKHALDRENVIQAVLLHFLENGIDRYDPRKVGKSGLLGYLGAEAYWEMKHLISRPATHADQTELLKSAVSDPCSDQDHRMMVLEDWFHTLIAPLKPVEREIGRLRFEEERTLKEIAERVGKPLSTVNDICQRIRSKAAELEQGEFGDG